MLGQCLPAPIGASHFHPGSCKKHNLNFSSLYLARSLLLVCFEYPVLLTKIMLHKNPVPVIDLFAGPGGLGEGFSSRINEEGNPCFRLRVSIEKDPVAHKTLSLRALFRAFPKNEVPEAYYRYIRGEISRDQLFESQDITPEARRASQEARNAELGRDSPEMIDQWIEEGIGNARDWVLIGGPPCQAYSIAGRSRRTRETQASFESDHKHFLYKEYLRIVRQFRPTVFVMENVKGILTSKNGGSHIFSRILDDLSNPAGDLSYQIRSLVVNQTENLDPQDFIIKAEDYGIPQARHRVILFGIRSDAIPYHDNLILKPEEKITVAQVLSDLPPLRSRLSRESDGFDAWLTAVHEAGQVLESQRQDLVRFMREAISRAGTIASTGNAFTQIEHQVYNMPENLGHWFLDARLGGVIQHETRSHMRSDLYRYFFASCFAKRYRYSPTLRDFPEKLLPKHGNVASTSIPFMDRFRVQLEHSCSTTVVAHIAKDGHYYIHHDPSQCRSLTVREAARLQTFPDNYFFEGNRTQQYTQVGNAVPPLLAAKIAEIVYRVIECNQSGKFLP